MFFQSAIQQNNTIPENIQTAQIESVRVETNKKRSWIILIVLAVFAFIFGTSDKNNKNYKPKNKNNSTMEWIKKNWLIVAAVGIALFVMFTETGKALFAKVKSLMA